jgi:hypothetical protein
MPQKGLQARVGPKIDDESLKSESLSSHHFKEEKIVLAMPDSKLAT